jgi:hypothetical protein
LKIILEKIITDLLKEFYVYQIERNQDDDYLNTILHKYENKYGENVFANILKKMQDDGFTNIDVRFGCQGDPQVSIKRPILTSIGISCAENKIKPWYKKVNYNFIFEKIIWGIIIFIIVQIIPNIDKYKSFFVEYILPFFK